MVTLEQVRAFDAEVKTTYPEGLVAVFAGATAGIGETSLREFARYVPKPRIYIVGRSKEACERLDVELRMVNPEGQYTFIRSDISLLHNVDDVCKEIRSKESAINVLFMSQGGMYFNRETKEGFNYIFALTYFGRLRMAANLLPLLQRANGLRRVVSSFTGAHEGKFYENDWQYKNKEVPMSAARGHIATVMTLGLEALARRAPDVTFIHNFPGAMNTNLIRGDEGFIFLVLKYVFKVTMIFKFSRALEVGQRHLFYCTSAKYPPQQSGKEGNNTGVPLRYGVSVSKGVDGKVGSGVYSIDGDGESISPNIETLLAKYREEGVVDRIWEYTESEFKRVTGTIAI